MTVTTETELTDSGAFVFRTPLLPYDEFHRWSEGLPQWGDRRHAQPTESVLEHDRAMLRHRLRDIIARPDVREALFVASAALHEELGEWIDRPTSEKGQRLERALVRYFSRMSTRPTPFGLFAGCSVGVIGMETRLALDPRASYTRRTELSTGYLSEVLEAVAHDPDARNELRYRTNPTLHAAGGALRYIESRRRGEERIDSLVAAEEDEALDSIVGRARQSATRAELAVSLVDDGVSMEEAEAYVDELIASQILQPDLAVPVTSSDPLLDLDRDLGELPAAFRVRKVLAEAHAAIRSIDAAGIGVDPTRYRIVATAMETLAKPLPPAPFRVDLIKPSPSASLGRAVMREMLRGLDVLRRIAPVSEEAELRRFKGAFVDRYEAREVPLLVALAEIGGGSEPIDGSAGDAVPLVAGLPFPDTAPRLVPWGRRKQVLLRKVTEAAAIGAREIDLSPADIEEMAEAKPATLPDAVSVVGTVASSGGSVVGRDFQVLLAGAFGPSGARLLGRFCNASETLRRAVERHLRQEEALDPDAVFAEVVFLPHGQLGNVACRPLLRPWEIPCVGRPGVPQPGQIALDDLLVSVVDDAIVLRSRRLGHRVIPRATSALNYRITVIRLERVVTETDLELSDGRTLHVYDDGADTADARLAVFWHHGTPNLGAPPEPLFPAAAQLGIRWVSYDRPGYGGSTPRPGRNVASAAADVSSIADALGIRQFAVMGHSGGGAHALACGALLPERVLGVVCVAGLAPFHAEGLDWFAGMAAFGAAELRAAARGRAALEDYLASTEFDPEQFTPADHGALAGPWSWLAVVAGHAMAGGMDGMVDDDLSYVAPWGFDPGQVRPPVLFLHGDQDRIAPRSHADWLARQTRSAELWLRPDDGHISVLNSGATAMGWLREHAIRAEPRETVDPARPTKA